MKLSVIGTGYLGATHAVCMAVLGHEVVGLDRDAAKVAALAAGTVPFFEPGLPALLDEALDSGRLRFSADVTEAADADVHFLCVGTPQRPGSGAADLSHLESALRELAPLLDRPTLVVGKSTVPVGTAARLTALLRSLAPVGAAAELAWNPEFLREGLAVEDTLRPERLVLGVTSAWAQARLEDVYRPLLDDGVPCVVTDLATAELVKVAANSFLATKISFINAMAEVCEASGADVTDLAAALALDGRIGGRFLRPGLGFGGGCLPKDLRAFAHRAEELGVGQAVSFLHDVDAINLRRRLRVVDLVRAAAGGNLAGVPVCLLGAAFKPGSDDVRDSPALDVARMLHAEGADVHLTDPEAGANARRVLPEVAHHEDPLTAAAGAHVVALLTEWEDYRSLDPLRLGSVVARRHVVDARHALDRDLWQAAGWCYEAPGRGDAVRPLQPLAPQTVPPQRRLWRVGA
ncbi:MAG: UDP-glucose dehydrogenase family protein [Nocardioides sp.]